MLLLSLPIPGRDANGNPLPARPVTVPFTVPVTGTVTVTGPSDVTVRGAAGGVVAGPGTTVAFTGTAGRVYVAAVDTGTGNVTVTVTNPAVDTISVLDYGADPTGVADSTTAIQMAINASPGGIVSIPTGTYLVSKTINLRNGVRVSGDGMGVTIIKASATFPEGEVFDRTSASSTDSIEHLSVEDLTINCTAGPTGSVDGIAIDTSVSEAVVYRDVTIYRVEVVDARLGVRSDGNNANGGPMDNQRTVSRCIFRNCALGVIATGTYAQQVLDSEFYGCTVAGIGTGGGVTPGAPTVNGQGPTTITRISRCHVEGLGNLSGTGTETESGIYVSASDLVVSDCYVSNVSRYGVWVESNEGMASLVDKVVVWGAGYSGLFLGGGNNGEQGVCSNCSLNNVSQTTSGNEVGECAVSIGSGNWTVRDVWIPTASNAPYHALGIGADTPDAYDELRIAGLDCPAPSSSWLYMFNTQTGTVKISDCVGFSPAGAQTAPDVPTSGTALTNPFNFDCTVYVNGGTVTAIDVSGTATGMTAGPVRVAAGQSITLTYSSAPTWTWFGD